MGRETFMNHVTDKFILSDSGLELSTFESFTPSQRVNAACHRDRNEIPKQLPDSIDSSEICECLTELWL